MIFILDADRHFAGFSCNLLRGNFLPVQIVGNTGADRRLLRGLTLIINVLAAGGPGILLPA